MRTLTLLLLSLLTFYRPNAQFKQIAEGPAFDEPHDGLSKITQLKDGSCIYLLYRNFKELYLQCYNNKHKQIAENVIPENEIDPDGYEIQGIYSDNSDLVLLLKVVNSDSRSLKRVKIDGRTGKIKEKKEIMKMQVSDFRKGLASAFGGDIFDRFYFSRNNDLSLGITSYNPKVQDINKRVELALFDSTHKEMAKGFFKSPSEIYNFVEVVDVTIIDKSRVCALVYAYSKVNDEKDCVLAMVTLDAESKTIKTQELEHSRNKLITGCVMRFNPISKKLIILSTSKPNRKEKFQDVLIAYFDPFNNKVDRTFEPFPVHANEKCIELFGKKNPYNGLPQNLYINDDGSFSVVYEEMTNIHYEHGTRADLGHLAVSQFDKDGREGNSYFIPKIHEFLTTGIRPFYQAKWDQIGSTFSVGDQYKPYSYLNGKKKNYILINDIEENGESALKGKITKIWGVGDCNAFYFATNGSEVLPERQFVFGEPAGKKENNLALLAISDYDRERNVYVTLKLEKEGRSKQVKLVWLEPK